MKGHGQTPSRKAEQASVALLTHPTPAEAADGCGVSGVTRWRRMQRPRFTEPQRAARRQWVEGAIASLQQTAGEALQALRCNLASGALSVVGRAALGVPRQAIGAMDAG